MPPSSPRFFSGFTALGLMARRRCPAQRKAHGQANGQIPAKKGLCMILSLALLNTSLSPVYAVYAPPQTLEATSDGGRAHTGSLGLKKLSRDISQEASQASVQTASYGFFTLFEGIAHLVSKSVTYVLKHPGQALTLGLAAQVAATTALSPLTDAFLINQNTTGNQLSPSVAALSDGTVFVTWSGTQTGNADIYGRGMAPTGTALTNEFRINQNTAADQLSPSVAALNNGSVFVVWHVYPTASPYDIYGRMMDPNGTALTNDFTVNQYTGGGQRYSSVAALSNGNAFAVWEAVPISTWNIYGRVLASNGTGLSSNFLICQNTAGTQAVPSVATLSTGNAFVVWQGDRTGNNDIYGRVFFPNGTALSNEFTVNQNTAGGQTAPSVAALNNGNAFVVWQGDQTGNLDIYGRVFFPNGTVFSNQFKINQVIDGTQANPSVAALSNGNAFVVWDGDQTGSSAIYGRVMAPNGTALSNEVGLNQWTLTGVQTVPAVATLSTGNVFVTWVSDQMGTPDIYGRLFDPSDPVVTTGPVTTWLPTTGLVTTGLQTTGLATTGLATTGSKANPAPILLGVGATVTAVLSLGVSLIGVCALGGFYGLKQYKKHQQKQSKNLDTATTSPTSSPSQMGAETYGTPPELLPKGFSEQEAVATTSLTNPPSHGGAETYGTSPKFLSEGFSSPDSNQETGATPFTVIPHSQTSRPQSQMVKGNATSPSHATRPKSHIINPQSHGETGNAYGTPPALLPVGFSHQH